MGYNLRSFRIIFSIFFVFQLSHCVAQRFSVEQLIGSSSINMTNETVPLHEDVADAFAKMKAAAHKDGIRLTAVSGYRSFERQKRIWERKYRNFIATGLSPIQAIEKIIRYSAIPGTSRHHWGTEVDIIDLAVEQPDNLLMEENYATGGCFSNLKDWMDKHARDFGFYLVYTQTDRKGFNYEPWHYSYMKVSRPMLRAYLLMDLPEVFKNFSFEGSSYLNSDILNKYIKDHLKDINPVFR